MSSKTYIGLHPNNLNRTEYGQVVLYVEGEPVAFFSGSGDVIISGSLGIEGITNVSASIAAAISTDTGSFMLTGSVNNDTITFTKGDGTTFDIIVNNVTSSLTASYVEVAQTASYVTLAQSASYVSLAQSASYVLNAVSASYATFTAFAEDAITASYAEYAVLSSTASLAEFALLASTASLAEFALLASTASYVENAQTASYVLNAISSSYTDFAENAVTASYVLNAVSASYATFAETSTTASYVENAVSASYVLNAVSSSYTDYAENAVSASYSTFAETAVTASYVENAVSASYVLNAVSASYATFAETSVTASYVLNAESASYAGFAETAVTASYVQNAESASYATFAETSVSSSYTEYAENAKTAETASSADDFLVRGDLEVRGIVTAQEFHTQFVSSSVIFSSGSTKFGDDNNDIHSFSGSVNVTQDVTAVDVNIDDWGSVSASLAALSTSAGALTLQQVTTQGSTTTDTVTVGGLVISTIYNANIDTDKFLVLDSSNSVTFRTGTQIASDIGALQTLQEVTDQGSTTTDTITAGGLVLSTIYNANIDTDKFLVLDASGNVTFRTGTQVLSDIEGARTLQQVTTAGSTTTDTITIGGARISTLYNANTDTDKFLVADASGNVVFRTGAQVASDIGALTSTPNLQAVTDIGATTTNSLTAAGLNLTSVSNAGTDTDKFLVLDSTGNVDYRTGAEVLSDIGAGGATLNLQDVTDNGNNTSNAISASALLIDEYAEITGDLVVGGSVTATEFYTTFVSSSILYQSGSTQFGDSGDDIHDFTGEVRVTNIVSSSDSYINDWGSISASLASIQSSAGVATLQDVTDNGNVTTLSITASGANLTGVTNAGADTDKFLVINSNGSVLFRTGDEIASDIGAATQSFDGNRPITQPLLPDLVDYNPGTSDIATFLEQVFYPDPGFGIEILTNEPFYILESELSSSFVRGATVSGTPVGNYYYQYGTASFEANTDVSWSLQTNSVLDIHPNTGELFIKINLSGSATYQAPKTIAGTVTANATSGGYKTRDFTVTVLENTGPTISTTDISNYSPKEASFVTASGAYIGQVYINEQTDPKGPPVIDTFAGSNPSLFSSSLASQAAGASYYNIYTTQALNSGSYVLNFTGSDLYGNETSASVTLVINANTAPELSIYSGFDGNIANYSTGDTYGQITILDNQGDAIDTFTLSGPDASDFTVQRVNSNMGTLSARGQGSGTGTERWAVKFATTPQIGSYNITASATDNFAFTGSLPIVNTLAASTPSLPSPNGTFHIIESAVSGDSVTTTSTGIAGTAATMTTNQPVSWSLADDLSGKLAISGSNIGYITLQGDLSGSSYQNGSVLTATVRATNEYNLFKENTITVNVEDNVPATVTTNFSPVNNHFATASNITFGTVTVTDPQSYENVQLDSIGGPDASKFQASGASPAQNVVYVVYNTQPLNSGSYILDFTSSDSYGQITKTGPVTLTVSPNNPPTITGAPFSKDYTEATTGDTVGTVQVADGDNGVDGVASFSLTGADSSKFSAVFVSTAGNLTKTYNINAAEDLAVGTYNISGSATDGFGHTVITPLATTITADAPAIPDSNAPFFAIESALAGASVTSDSSGIPGTVAAFTTNQTVTWSLTNGIWLDINSSGELSLKVNLSGSAKQAGAQINDEVVATNGAGTSSTLQFVVTVTNDQDPVITSGLTTTKNNNKTTGSADFGTITISDPQSLGNVTLTDFNGPDVGSFSFNPGAVSSTTVYSVTSAGALNSGSYSFSVTGSDAYNQEAKAAFTITVTENLPPTLTQTGFTKTTGQATNGATVGTIQAEDPQDDSIASFNLSGTDSSKFTAVLNSSTATSKLYNINTTQNLDPGTYNLTASATDSFGLSVTEPVPVTITAVAPDTPTKSHAQFYIIESATSSVAITGDSSGVPGSLARMTTDQSVSWSLTPPTYLTIDSDGYLSLQANVSGSAKTAGGEIVVDVTATNTFGATSVRTVDVDVTANLAPALTYTGLTVVSGSASANGQTVGTVTATDTQAVDGIKQVAITGGTDAASFALALTTTTANSKVYNINTAADLDGGSYQIQLTATDTFNKQTVETKTITVTTPATTTVYAYTSNAYNTALNTTPTAAEALQYGFGYVNSTHYAGFLGKKLIDGDAVLGDSTIAVQGGTVTLRQSGTIESLTDLVTLGKVNSSGTAAGEQVMIFFPNSAGALDSIPSSMFVGSFTGTPGGTFNPTGGNGQHGLVSYSTPSSPFVIQAVLHTFTVTTAIDGYTDWGVIMTYDAPTSNTEFSIPLYGDTLPTL